MCLMFIVLLLKSSKFNSLPRIYFGVKRQRSKVKGQNYNVDSKTSSQQSPESDSQHPSSIIHQPYFLFSAKGGFRSAYRTGRLAQLHPSSIFQHPLAICLLPGIWFLLTSLWSSYPEISALRAAYFILISIGCISAGILWVRYSEKNIFDFLLPANVIVVLICVFSILTDIPSDSWTGGHGKGFMGFFGHQNLLASVTAFYPPCYDRED